VLQEAAGVLGGMEWFHVEVSKTESVPAECPVEEIRISRKKSGASQLPQCGDNLVVGQTLTSHFAANLGDTQAPQTKLLALALKYVLI
jgi:hypothetical protein